MLSDYEIGRAISSIEWVARGKKPIAEIGCRRLAINEAKNLQRELDSILEVAKEPAVKAYVLELAGSKFVAFGFYAEPWALEARLYLESHDCPDWLQGLVFGYEPNSIQRFIESVAQSPPP